MKIPSAAVTLLSTLPALLALADAQECVTGGFRFEFDGACTADAVVAAYEDQVFYAAGGTSSTCAASSSARADLEAKLEAMQPGMSIDDLCTMVYNTQKKVPFTHAAKRGTDLRFEQMFFNGRTDWQEEVETLFEREDYAATSILKEDAEAVRTFFEGTAQGRRVEWPGSLTNFQSSVTDSNDLATCTTNAAMCCWPKDRQAGDGNGNCASPYDTNCVDKDPADNTDLCFVDMENGNRSTGFDSTDTIVFPGDNDQGEGSIHCHGLAWSNNANDHTARYKANNLFFVSMYDHMYQRGYVKNIPGAPMCGCVEQMPTVSRSDCTQVDLTESVVIEFDGSAFTGKLDRVHVDFNACQGIDHRNNDLWAYIARLYYQGDITPEQFGEAGKIITDKGCEEATSYHLDEMEYTPGYDHTTSMWTNVAGRESLKLNDGYGHRAFNKSLRPGSDPLSADPTKNHYGIIFRACATCVRTHKHVYYRRRTPVPEAFSLVANILHHRNDGGGNNRWDEDFSLHSTYFDALNNLNPWRCPGGKYNYDDTFSGRCSPEGNEVKEQYSIWSWFPGPRSDVAFYVNKPEDEGLEIIEAPSTLTVTPVKGHYGKAGGMALRDPMDGTIYMTGSGDNISGNNDDFNFLSQPADGDHTVIVHASKISSPEPDSSSKAGIMFRKSMDPASPHFFVHLTGSNGVCTTGRRDQGGWDSSWGCVKAGATEAWLKVEKRMDRFTSFVGTQEVPAGPIKWTVLKSQGGWTNIGNSYEVGLAVASRRSLAQEVVFKDLEIDQFYFPSAAPSVSGMPSIEVKSADIGSVGIAGRARQLSDGSWSVTASGSDIWNSWDQFHFVHFDPRSNPNVKAEIYIKDFQPVVDTWQKAGPMIRESLNGNSRHFSMFYTSSFLSNQWRGCTGCGSGHHTPNYTARPKPIWLQVKKVGNVFTASYKYKEADNWILWNTATINFQSSTFYVGIAVTAHRNDKTATLTAHKFIVEDLPTAPARRLRSGSK